MSEASLPNWETAASSGALDILERYAQLDPAIVHAFGVEPPSPWRVK